MSQLLWQNRVVRFQLPAILCAFFIFIGSSIPSEYFPSLSIFEEDKLIHFVFFFALSFLTYRAFKFQTRYPHLSKYALGASLLFTVLYGAVDEFHQMFVPGRSADLLDLLADSLGALVCILALYIWPKFSSASRKSMDL
jgi:VanZ family protein